MNNPFALFGLPIAFDIDLTALNQRYLALQKSLHPDNFVGASTQEQRLAMQKSAEINDALQILKDPILRAENIVALNTGNQVNIEQKSSHDLTFLMQQMEWRETLEHIERTHDNKALTQFACDIQQIEQQILAELAQALKQQNWSLAQQMTDKLRFLKKLNLEIERVEEQLFAM